MLRCSSVDDLDAIEKETSSVHPRHNENRVARSDGLCRKESQNGIATNGIALLVF